MNNYISYIPCDISLSNRLLLISNESSVTILRGKINVNALLYLFLLSLNTLLIVLLPIIDFNTFDSLIIWDGSLSTVIPMMTSPKRAKNVRSTDGKIIPISNQDFEIWNGTLLLYEYLEESPNYVPIPNIHFLMVNLHEQHFYGFV